MISQLSISLSQGFIVLLKLLISPNIGEILKYVIVNKTDKQVTYVKDDRNHETNKEINFRLQDRES